MTAEREEPEARALVDASDEDDDADERQGLAEEEDAGADPGVLRA